MRSIEFVADRVVLEGSSSITLTSSSGAWLGFSRDEDEELPPDDPTGRIYSEYDDQGNGGWGGIEAAALTQERLLLTLAGEREAVLDITLELSPESHAALRERLTAIFKDAPSRLQVATRR